jgi:Ala-tRNA(Pro) deacylase
MQQMNTAKTLLRFLSEHDFAYECVCHKRTQSSLRSAAEAHVPSNKVAKSVLLKDGSEYLMAVLPASRKVHLGRLHRMLQRQIGLATEKEIGEVFSDCAPGAIPPTGLLYGVDTWVDEELLDQPDVYFESGDHEQLVHMNQREFRKLLGDSTRAHLATFA